MKRTEKDEELLDEISLEDEDKRYAVDGTLFIRCKNKKNVERFLDTLFDNASNFDEFEYFEHSSEIRLVNKNE